VDTLFPKSPKKDFPDRRSLEIEDLDDLEVNHLAKYGWAFRKDSSTTTDKASLAQSPGGIDLNSRHLNLESSGQKVNIAFDPVMIAQFRRGDFSGVRIKILDVVPVNLIPLLGLREERIKLALR
jgi:hypothetical protein